MTDSLEPASWANTDADTVSGPTATSHTETSANQAGKRPGQPPACPGSWVPPPTKWGLVLSCPEAQLWARLGEAGSSIGRWRPWAGPCSTEGLSGPLGLITRGPTTRTQRASRFPFPLQRRQARLRGAVCPPLKLVSRFWTTPPRACHGPQVFCSKH